MPIHYQIGQLALPARLVRFARRTRGTNSASTDAPLTVTGRFDPQHIVVGERLNVVAVFIGNLLWRAVTGSFKLQANGSAVSGYENISATLYPDSSGHITTVSALLDAGSGAAPTLLPGTYTGLFSVTDSIGMIYVAEGSISVQTETTETPVEVTLGGGEG